MHTQTCLQLKLYVSKPSRRRDYFETTASVNKLYDNRLLSHSDVVYFCLNNVPFLYIFSRFCVAMSLKDHSCFFFVFSKRAINVLCLSNPANTKSCRLGRNLGSCAALTTVNKNIQVIISINSNLANSCCLY